MPNNKLGKILRERRKEKDWRLADVALRADISIAEISRIEEGKRFPSARTLSKLAKVLGFNEIELFKMAGFLSPNNK